MKSKIEKNWDHYTNHIFSFLDSEKENFGKWTDDETNEKVVTHDAYSQYTGETGIRPLTRRYFFAIIRAMKDKKMLSGYDFSAFQQIMKLMKDKKKIDLKTKCPEKI